VPVAGPDASAEAREAVEQAQRAAAEADRIRVEAQERAARESAAAMRKAEETVHRIRSETLARADASGLAGGGEPGADATADAAEAERAEADAAERRAALQARRERELAHRRAQAETAEADQRARDAAARAAALVARPVAAPDPGITLDRSPGLAVGAAVAPGRPEPGPPPPPGAAAVPAVQPGAERAPAAVATAAPVTGGPLLRTGEIPCRDCGEGNETTRRFCRRCGRPMLDDAAPEGPRLRWWQRLLQRLRLRRQPAARSSGEFRGQAAPRSSVGAQLKELVQSVMSLAQMIVVVALALGIGLSLGPLRSQVSQRIDSVRRVVAPRPRFVKDVVASGSQPTVSNLVDTHKDTVWTAPSGATVHFAFPAKIHLFKVGIEAGTSNPPDRLVLAVSGGTARSCTLNFTGTSGFESFTCKVSGAQAADLTAFGASGQPLVTLAEVEFFEVS